MTRLRLDYEGYCDTDLIKQGLDRYSSDPSADVFMMAYQVDNSPVQHWERDLGPFPSDVRYMLMDGDVEKRAFNATFERVMTNRVLKIPSPIRGWRCTMVDAYLQSFFGGLEQVGEQMGIAADRKKLTTGKQLISMFCMPQRVSKSQPYARRDRYTDPEKWQDFCDYNVQDVIAEAAIETRLSASPAPAVEWEYYAMDQVINDRGFPVNVEFVRQAIIMAAKRKAVLVAEMRELTGLDNPNSNTQLLPWLIDQGYPYKDLQAPSVEKTIKLHGARLEAGKSGVVTDLCLDVLKRRQWAARTSTAKYETILKRIGRGDVLRYLFQFCGAGRTARWAGRGVQTQNLPRTPKVIGETPSLRSVTRIIESGDYDMLDLYMTEPMEALVGCVRSAFQPVDGEQFVIADLSSIETVVIAWLSGCKRLLDVFAQGKDPYKDFASLMFKKAYEEVTKFERQICKPPVLGCGYRLGGGEIYDGKKTGLWGYAENMGVDMTHDEAHTAVGVYRSNFVEVPAFWKALESAVALCMMTSKPQTVGFLRFERKPPFLLMRLPSGRAIHYYSPKMQTEIVHTGRYVTRIARTESDFFYYGAKIGEEYQVEETYKKLGFSYMGKQQNGNQYIRIPTHGGRFCEQATQATAREVFAAGALRAHKRGFKLCGHAHDENVARQRIGDNQFTVAQLIEDMTDDIAWAPGLPLKAAGYLGDFYRKDE